MNVPLPKYAERGPIHDVVWVPLKFYHDQRGWLVELFRNDLIDPKFHPVMAYVSQTKPGVTRGPSEPVFVAAIRSIMEECSWLTCSRVRPSRSIMVPGTAVACCRNAAPRGVSPTARVRSSPGTRWRVMNPAASRRRTSRPLRGLTSA